MSAPAVTNRKRMFVFLILITLIMLILIGRVGYIQIVWGRDLQKKALDQWTRTLDLYPLRGVIYDRTGERILAQSASADSLAARPSQLSNPRDVSAMLAPILGLEEEELYNKLSEKNKSEVWIKRQLTREESVAVRELNIKGLYFAEEPKRYYPNGHLASHLLGFTMKYSEPGEGLKGQEGVELYYDKYLRGIPGELMTETDARGREIPNSTSQRIPPIDGWDVILTIDKVIQHFTEKALDDAMDKYQATKIYAIVMDPKTGEILAMANRPDFNPNNPPRELGYEEMGKYIKNISVKDNMDPGSTFKVITTAAALEEKVANLNSSFNCPGYRVVDGKRIKCHKAGGHGHQTLKEAVQNSCNPSFMDMALSIGTDRFYNYITAFGFGQRTGIDINGEEGGLLIPKANVKNVDLARMGFGQAISVTPIQLITAVSAVINGGNLMEPHIVKALQFDDGKNKIYEEIPPAKIRQVISPETSKTMRDILLSVVSEGGGKNAYIPGYRVGGKTGTAQKYSPQGGILDGKHIASFIGFAPAEDPQVVVLLMVDEPQVAVDFGSVVAAPYVKMIMEDTLKYMGVEPVFDEKTEEESKVVTVPDLSGMNLKEASTELSKLNLTYAADETGTIVKDQMPKPGAQVMVKTTILLYMGQDGTSNSGGDDTDNSGKGSGEEQTDPANQVEVPDLRNLSVREANIVLASKGLELKLEGRGIAVSQDPPPGTKVPQGSVVSVEFEMPQEN